MTERQQARKTALVVAAALAVFAAWNVWRGRPPVAASLGGAAAALLAIGVLWSWAAVRFHRGWMLMAAGLAFVNTRILLGAMYWGVITPVGWIMRLLGRDALMRRGTRDSYWVVRQSQRQLREGFERTF